MNWKQFVNWREWNLLGQAVWSGAFVLVLLGLKKIFDASGLPDSVRFIAAFASVPVLLIGLGVLVMSSDAWARRKYEDLSGRGDPDKRV